MNKGPSKRKSILKQASICFQPPDISQLTLENTNHINNHVKIDAHVPTVIVVEGGKSVPQKCQKEEVKNQQQVQSNSHNKEQQQIKNNNQLFRIPDVPEIKRVSNKYPTMKEADLIKLALSNPKIWEDDDENEETEKQI